MRAPTQTYRNEHVWNHVPAAWLRCSQSDASQAHSRIQSASKIGLTSTGGGTSYINRCCGLGLRLCSDFTARAFILKCVTLSVDWSFCLLFCFYSFIVSLYILTLSSLLSFCSSRACAALHWYLITCTGRPWLDTGRIMWPAHLLLVDLWPRRSGAGGLLWPCLSTVMLVHPGSDLMKPWPLTPAPVWRSSWRWNRKRLCSQKNAYRPPPSDKPVRPQCVCWRGLSHYHSRLQPSICTTDWGQMCLLMLISWRCSSS